MLRYDNYFIPKNLDEYFNLLTEVKDYRIVAGCERKRIRIGKRVDL